METALTVLIQPKGILHRFIRQKDASTIVERPERLRAVVVGAAAALVRLHEEFNSHSKQEDNTDDLSDELTSALNRLNLLETPKSRLCEIVTSTSSADILTNDATKFVHGDAENYVAKLSSWALGSEDKIRQGESEIPSGLSQGDLYCRRSFHELSV